MTVLRRIDWEEFEGEFTEVSIGASMRVHENVPSDWVDENGQFTPPITVPKNLELFRTRWNLGFEYEKMSYAGIRKGTSCEIKNWYDGQRMAGNPSPYYPGPASHYLYTHLPHMQSKCTHLDSTFGNHYDRTVSMIANKVASKLLSDPFGDWRINWEIHVPIFSGHVEWFAYFGEGSLEAFEIT